MSGQKRLIKAVKHNRVVALPSKKRKDIALDENGNPLRDKKTGEVIYKEVQLYKIKPMR